MKKVKILTLALIAMLYSCGNSGNGSNEQKTDSLVTTKTVQTSKQQLPKLTEAEKAVVYKYFSEAEMKENLSNAEKYFSENDYPYYADLLEREGFTSSDKLEKKWGSAEEKNKENIVLDYGDGLVFNKMVLTMQFNQFNIILENCMDGFPDDSWIVSELETETPGFGFGGVYVGVPECNKAYLLKLFEKFEIEESEYDGIKSLEIVLNSDFYTAITVKLDKNERVTFARYSAHVCAD